MPKPWRLAYPNTDTVSCHVDSENHVMMVDLRPRGLNGAEVSQARDEACIIVNKNSIPFDSGTPMKPSGIRIGMKEDAIVKVADFIDSLRETEFVGEVCYLFSLGADEEIHPQGAIDDCPIIRDGDLRGARGDRASQ